MSVAASFTYLTRPAVEADVYSHVLPNKGANPPLVPQDACGGDLKEERLEEVSNTGWNLSSAFGHHGASFDVRMQLEAKECQTKPPYHVCKKEGVMSMTITTFERFVHTPIVLDKGSTLKKASLAFTADSIPCCRLRMQMLPASDPKCASRTHRIYNTLNALRMFRHIDGVPKTYAIISRTGKKGLLKWDVYQEYFRGNLFSHINTYVLQERQIQFILDEVGKVLHRIHAKGFTYKDLKNDNILLNRDEDGEIMRVAVTDLEFMLGEGGAITFSPIEVVKASEAKTGEERAKWQQKIGPPRDYWALGLALFQMIFRQNVPWINISTVSTVAEEIEKASKLSVGDAVFGQTREDVSKKLITTCQKLLSLNPEERLMAFPLQQIR